MPGSCSTKDPTPHALSGHNQGVPATTTAPASQTPEGPPAPPIGYPWTTPSPPTVLTHRSLRHGTHRDPRQPVTPFLNTHHINIAQTHQQLAHEPRINNHRGPLLGCRSTPDYGGSSLHSRRFPNSPLIFEAPLERRIHDILAPSQPSLKYSLPATGPSLLTRGYFPTSVLYRCIGNPVLQRQTPSNGLVLSPPI